MSVAEVLLHAAVGEEKLFEKPSEVRHSVFILTAFIK
jgi:hypothetical protein